MCNEYARQKSLEKLIEEFSQVPRLPLFRWREGRIPNDLSGKLSVRIGDVAPIVRLEDGLLTGEMAQWAWKAPSGKPVFNFVADGRDFSRAHRVLVPADGFYEFTAPTAPKVKLKDKHLFTMAAHDWFWIAGIVRDACFTLLTVKPGPDLVPYHDRQIVVLTPEAGLDWLTLSRPTADILRAPPAGGLSITTIRRDGVDLAA